MEKQSCGTTFIVNKERTKTVLIYHKKYQNWIQPGGKSTPGEDTKDTAIRKAYEETGLKVKIVDDKPLYVEEYSNFVGNFVDYQFLAEPVDENQPLINGPGSYAIDWFSLDELNSIPVFPDVKIKLKTIINPIVEVNIVEELS